VFDTHCHLSEFEDAAAVVARAEAAGVTRMLLAGVAPSGWGRDDRLAERHAALFVSYGVHPQLVREAGEASFDDYMGQLDDRLARRGPRVVAVGEIGLDGKDEHRGSLELQERYFRAQLQIARRHALPVALHVLRQHPRALAILADEGVPHGGVLHSCSASSELTRDYVALGLHVSFSGSVTWHGGDNRAARAAETVPRDRLVVETDAPDQTPEARRPGRNEPAFLVEIVRAIAHLWGVEFAEAARLTDDNARRLLKL
jgi:TatD DNase family protein